MMRRRPDPKRQPDPEIIPLRPPATPVPIEELSAEGLRMYVNFIQSKEHIDHLARVYDAIARGLVPNAALPSAQPLDTLKRILNPRQFDLLNWLYMRPGMFATFREVALCRMRKQNGEPSAMKIKAAGNDLRRLQQKLEKMGSRVQIDIQSHEIVRLRVLSIDPV
jgi:hypothetical protein